MTTTHPAKSKMKTNVATLIAALAVVFAAGCEKLATPAALSPTAQTKPTTPQVTIDNFSFTPATLTIAVGATVNWTNHDDVPHTVTADDKAFASKALDTDDAFSHTFTKPGTYSYFCAVHPHMTGVIVVK
jgi:plastocyanin